MTDSQSGNGVKNNIPNILTIGRIVSIPVLMWGILSLRPLGFEETSSYLAVLVPTLFILLALTDYLDGYLARKWGVTSDFGRMIDPIADKLFVAGCLITLCVVYLGAWTILIPSCMIIGRDIFVSGLREHAALNAIVMPPTKLAKWKTAFEMLAILLLILSFSFLSTQMPRYFDSLERNASPSLPHIFETTGIITLWIAAILSFYTGALYLRATIKKN